METSDNLDMSFAKLFRVGDVTFGLMHKASVVNPCPFIPINENDEKSCYSSMLLYIPWSPEGNEVDDRLYKEGVSAVERLGTLMADVLLPTYVANFLTRIRRSEELRDSNGTPAPTVVLESLQNDEEDIDPTGYISENVSHHSEDTADEDVNVGNVLEHVVEHDIVVDLSNAGVMVHVSSKTKEYFKSFIEVCLKDDQRK